MFLDHRTAEYRKIPNGNPVNLEASDEKHWGTQMNLLEQILSRENMHTAWKRVKANRDAAGMDVMSIGEFPEFTRHHWDRIRSASGQQWIDLHYGPGETGP